MKREEKHRIAVSKFIENYSIKHNRMETLHLIKNIIDKKNIKELPESLRNIDKSELSMELSRIVTVGYKYLLPEEKEYYVNEMLPIIIKNIQLEKQKNNKIANKIANKLTIRANEIKHKLSNKLNYSLNKKVILGTIITSTVLSGMIDLEINNESNDKTLTENNNDTIEYIANSIVKAGNARVVVDSTYKLSEEELKYKDIGTNDKNNIIKADGLRVGIDSTFKLTKEQKEAERKALEEYKLATKKQKVFNNPRQINNINDIFKAQEELESLGLTDEDKIYPDCPLDAPIQWFIDGQARLRGVPTAFPFSIVSTETRGQFNSSGVTAYNTDSVDLGLSQQNSKYRVLSFAKKYNIDYNTAYLLIRDNDYVNMVSAFDTFDDIDRVKGNFQPTEYAGCYNGWLKWRNYETSRQYVAIFNEAYGKYTNTKVEPKALTK